MSTEWEPSPVRVLVVEDDVLIAWGLVTLLEAAGYFVCGIARDADGALSSAELECPDIVLMDIELAKGTDGIAAAGELRKRLNLPTVFLSGSLDPETRERAAQVEPLAMITKPYRPDMLLQVLEGCRN